MKDLAQMTITEAAPLIEQRQVSPVELVRACLARIDKYEPQVQAWVTIVADQALAEAAKAEEEIRQGHYRGPLHGIPYGAKDIYCTAGIRTAAGSAVHPDYVPTEDATIIRLLKEAGAILLGKTTTSEYAFLWGTQTTRNPWNLKHTPGGSSTGSGAAVGADMALFGLGTQTVGSLLRPSAYNNLTCLKGTYGRSSCYQVIPCSKSLDHTGALTKSVEDTVLLSKVLYAYDPLDPASLKLPTPELSLALHQGLAGVRIGVPTSFFVAEDAVINDAYQEALKVLEEAGATLLPVRVPELMEDCFAAQDIVMCAEAADYHLEHIQTSLEHYQPYTCEQLKRGRGLSAIEYIRAQEQRRIFKQQMLAMYAEVDVVVTPATLTLPPTGLYTGSPRLNGPFTNAGFPAMTVPMGFDAATNLPMGLQITAPPLEEARIISVGAAYQQLTSWHSRHALP